MTMSEEGKMNWVVQIVSNFCFNNAVVTKIFAVKISFT